MTSISDGPVFSNVKPVGARVSALSVAPTGGARMRVVVLPGIHGRTPHILQVCQRLANHGCEAIVADFYCTAAQRGEIRTPADIGVAAAALDHEQITSTVVELIDAVAESGPTAVLGYCVGGAIGLLATGRTDAVTATVAYYGVLRTDPPVPGRPDAIEAAGKITSPVLAHYGTTDIWCSSRDVDDLEASLAGSGSAYQVYRYPGAGHAFEETESAGFRPVAAADAARRTMSFLDHYAGRR